MEVSEFLQKLLEKLPVNNLDNKSCDRFKKIFNYLLFNYKATNYIIGLVLRDYYEETGRFLELSCDDGSCGKCRRVVFLSGVGLCNDCTNKIGDSHEQRDKDENKSSCT